MNKVKWKNNYIDNVLYLIVKVNNFEVEENFLIEKYVKCNFR